jgi:hypothetical protein
MHCSKKTWLPWSPKKINNPNLQFSKAHLTTFKVYNLKMIEVMGLNILHQSPFEWHYFLITFHETLPSGSEVIRGGHTDKQTHRQTGDLIILLSFLESRLKEREGEHKGGQYCRSYVTSTTVALQRDFFLIT